MPSPPVQHADAARSSPQPRELRCTWAQPAGRACTVPCSAGPSALRASLRRRAPRRGPGHGAAHATQRSTHHKEKPSTHARARPTEGRSERRTRRTRDPHTPTNTRRYMRAVPRSLAPASVRPGALNISSVKKNAGARSRAAFPFAGFGADCGARCSGLSSPARLAARPDSTRARRGGRRRGD